MIQNATKTQESSTQPQHAPLWTVNLAISQSRNLATALRAGRHVPRSASRLVSAGQLFAHLSKECDPGSPDFLDLSRAAREVCATLAALTLDVLENAQVRGAK